MSKLTTAERNALPASDFAGPDRSYPVNDANHARAALSMSAKYASPELQSKVKSKVHSKFSHIGSKQV